MANGARSPPWTPPGSGELSREGSLAFSSGLPHPHSTAPRRAEAYFSILKEWRRTQALRQRPALPVTLVLDGREVTISNPDKLFFSERGETKLDLVLFYQTVRDPLLAAMGGRPVLLQRFPEGAGGSSFFQKRVPAVRPSWLQTAVVSTPNGTTSDALVAADLAHVIWAVNLGCIGFHVWPSQADDPEHADELRIDLDPSPGVTFAMVQEAAREVRRLFDGHGLSAMPKTTGNRGIHIYVRLQPRWTSYEVRSAAVAVARELERRRPELMT